MVKLTNELVFCLVIVVKLTIYPRSTARGRVLWEFKRLEGIIICRAHKLAFEPQATGPSNVNIGKTTTVQKTT